VPADPLGPGLQAKVAALFGPDDAPAATALLEAQCGEGLPLIASQGANGIERVRCAVLKLSGGSLEALEAAVRRANRDWRDVLVWSGFGDDPLAHRAWLHEG
jgi:hypothetical protein